MKASISPNTNKRNFEVVKVLINSCLKLLVLAPLISSCVKQTDAPSIHLDSCANINGENSNCNLETSQTVYVYDTSFGGRETVVSSPINVPDDVRTFNLPTGWYQGVQINFNTPDILPVNANRIRSGTEIFGVTGTFVSVANPACTANGLQSSDCSAAEEQYLYSGAYGGRGATCTNYDNGLPNSTCWVSQTGSTIDSTPSNPSNCSVEGSQSAICTGTHGTYYYGSEYGGRSNTCVNGYNPNACWVPQAGKFLTNSGAGCTENSFNSTSCGTQPGRYVYTDEYGGRNSNCSNDLNGLCYVTQSSKVQLEPNLTPDRIRIGKTLFGVTGTFSGTGDWYSGMHRDQDTAPITMSVEAAVFAGASGNPNLPGGYRMVASILRDDEGYLSTEVSHVDRTGWGSISCGTTQNTISARLTHCESVFGANAVWDGSVRGNAGHSRWKLVTRSGALSSAKGREVWLDEKTGLLWSSLVSRSINWCKAVGSSNNIAVNARYREDDSQDICDQDVNQNNTSGLVVSACFEETGFTPVDSDIDNQGKGGLGLSATATSPAVAWRVPTFNDYELADFHGIRFVLPDMGTKSTGDEWIANVVSTNINMAWTFFPDFSFHGSRPRNQKVSVRCVGR